MKKKINVKFRVIDAVFLPSDPEELVTFIRKSLENIPKEFRDKAKFEFNNEYDYEDTTNVYLEIAYVRPETKIEQGKREHIRILFNLL